VSCVPREKKVRPCCQNQEKGSSYVKFGGRGGRKRDVGLLLACCSTCKHSLGKGKKKRGGGLKLAIVVALALICSGHFAQLREEEGVAGALYPPICESGRPLLSAGQREEER